MVRLAEWCNGSTTHFGCVCLGSNPSSASKKYDYECKSKI